MGSLFSSLSSGITTPLLRAGVMPAAAFTVLFAALVVPLAPEVESFLVRLDPAGGDTILVGLGFVTVILAGLLLVVSDLLVRLYEGYYWRHGVLGRWLTSRRRAEFDRVSHAVDGIEALRKGIDETHESQWKTLRKAVTPRKYHLRSYYPDRADLVLPTRLGNTIRSFERYPSVEYEIEAVILWDHLSAVMDDSHLTRVEQARANLNFLLNLSLLLGTLAVILASLAVLAPEATLLNAGVPAAAMATLSILAYRGSLWLALNWGDAVRTSFDLYRDRLFEELGHGKLPESRIAEREEWEKITKQILFGDRHGGPHVEKDAVTGEEEADPDLEVARGVRPAWLPGQLEIVVQARNPGKEPMPAPVAVKVPVPEGYAYVWDSARTAAGNVSVSGDGPYTFTFDTDLAPDDAADLTFRVLAVQSSPTL